MKSERGRSAVNGQAPRNDAIQTTFRIHDVARESIAAKLIIAGCSLHVRAIDALPEVQ